MEPLPILKLTLSGDSALHILEKRKIISTMAKDVKQDLSMYTWNERGWGEGGGGWRREGMDGEACKDMGLGKGGHTLLQDM